MKLDIGKQSEVAEAPACPVCDKILDGATAVNCGDAIPKSGDLTVCCVCRSFLTFTDGMKLRLLTEEEIVDLSAHSRATMIEMREVLREMKNG